MRGWCASAWLTAIIAVGCSSASHTGASPPSGTDAGVPGVGVDASPSSDSATGSAINGATGSAIIGAAGGRVATADGHAILDLPPGALPGEVPITIAPATNPPPGAIGTAYEIGPTGTIFAQPARLTLAYDPSQLGGATQDELEVATEVDGAWLAQPSSAIDTNDRLVSAWTTHLSLWAVIPAKKDPCQCHVAQWETCCKKLSGTPVGDSPAACACVGPDLLSLSSCYTQAVGGSTVANFCSGCLAGCCAAAGGHASQACDCVVDSSDRFEQVKACSAKCFGPGGSTTVCTSPGGSGGSGSPGDAGAVAMDAGCGAATCANGCCDPSGACQSGTAGPACGRGGAVCSVCASGESCDATRGACVCNGCRDSSGACQVGSDPAACGTGGGSCSACAAGQRCELSSGTCVCDDTSCPNGCCDANGACQGGTASTACGSGGQRCVACAGTETCGGTGQRGCSSTPDGGSTPSCDASSCGSPSDGGSMPGCDASSCGDSACVQDNSLVCDPGYVGFTCSGNAHPDPLNWNCGPGVTEDPAGVYTGYCCH